MTKPLFAVLALALAIAAPAALLDAKPAAAARDWRTTIAVTADGNAVMGDPAAPLKLVEYVSFACSHCADFAAQSRARLEGDWVKNGLVSVERRPTVLENQPFALVAALVVQCGAPERWFANGDAMLAAQPGWLPKVLDPALQQKWNAQPANRFAVTMAHDLGFYELMQSRGLSEAQIDGCLTDQARIQSILKTTNYGFATIGISGTPSLLINDSLLSFFDWPNLEGLIEAMLPQ
ncbi:thioredoxin domain-containing protein [Novosphingobium sp.]|uniref:DsbA family protein n=1 Tax=Novosphingobium sp. TaxID=1874826 RepID=UPI00286CB2D9|nr:thioredoxin domain-containing protein [Novosphingobium sp.]